MARARRVTQNVSHIESLHTWFYMTNANDFPYAEMGHIRCIVETKSSILNKIRSR